MRQKPFIITITGPESSGKTTLARKLAGKLGSIWVPEYAREYLSRVGKPYDIKDLALMAQGQWTWIEQARAKAAEGDMAIQESTLRDVLAQSYDLIGSTVVPKEGQELKVSAVEFYLEAFGDQPRPVIIVDCGMLSLRIWSKLKYGVAVPIVEQWMAEDHTSMYVLCRPVLPWEPDPLREAPLLLDRIWIFNHMHLELIRLQKEILRTPPNAGKN